MADSSFEISRGQVLRKRDIKGKDGGIFLRTAEFGIIGAKLECVVTEQMLPGLVDGTLVRVVGHLATNFKGSLQLVADAISPVK